MDRERENFIDHGYLERPEARVAAQSCGARGFHDINRSVAEGRTVAGQDPCAARPKTVRDIQDCTVKGLVAFPLRKALPEAARAEAQK
jgi:hypothetical protein